MTPLTTEDNGIEDEIDNSDKDLDPKSEEGNLGESLDESELEAEKVGDEGENIQTLDESRSISDAQATDPVFLLRQTLKGLRKDKVSMKERMNKLKLRIMIKHKLPMNINIS